MKSLYSLCGCALLAGSLSVAPAAAQQSGLVNVNLSNIDVRVDLADLLDIDVSQVPVNVQVPIGVAANVCGVAANVLAADVNQDGSADCTAENSSTALARFVQSQM